MGEKNHKIIVPLLLKSLLKDFMAFELFSYSFNHGNHNNICMCLSFLVEPAITILVEAAHKNSD